MTLRRLSGIAKASRAIEVVREITARGQKVVVFAHHVEVIRRIADAFPSDQMVQIHGDTSHEARRDAVDRFQHDPAVTVFVGSIRVAGQGITLTAASRILFVEVEWSPMVNNQAEDRCHRMGQEEELLVQYLYVKGTLDERVGAILRKKQELMQPLYTSFSLAEVPLHERQPPDLEAHLSEMRERAAAARERVQRLSAEDATDKQSFEQLARDARAQLEARQRDERERLEVKVAERREQHNAEDAMDKQSFEQLARDARAQLEARQRDERERLEVKVAERREQHTQTLQARSRDLKEAVQEAEQAEAVVQDELGRSLRAAAMAAAKRQANDADVRSSSIDGDRSAADSDPGTGEQLSEDDEDFGDARPI